MDCQQEGCGTGTAFTDVELEKGIADRAQNRGLVRLAVKCPARHPA